MTTVKTWKTRSLKARQPFTLLQSREGGYFVRAFAVVCVLLVSSVFGLDARALSVDRNVPEEWKGLVIGGRFMDRFLPMPVQGKLSNDTWGGDNVRPRYVDNGIEDDTWSYWGGNAKLGKDGKYHLYVCRWREDSEKGHNEWPRSEVVHAVAENSYGPYRVKETLGKGHNPEVFQLSDGRYVVYVMNGYYIADGVDGPWEYNQFEFNTRDRKIIEGLSNLSFAPREDGSVLMVCRGGGIWVSQTGISPYQQVTDERVYPPVEGAFEDPVIWRTNVQYHLVVNDWYGRIAYYLRSKDGIHWKVEPGEAYLPGIARCEDGTESDWYKYERIKVLQDEYGRATQAHFAVIDVVKNEDKGNDNHSSKHICIPLTVGRLLTILDQDPITAETKMIRVKIAVEAGFNPHTDVDVYSLRFGAAEEVNFGRGAKMLKTERAGDDLIVTFDGTGNGITETNFAAKLLGKTTEGKLLFGYARLPWLNYLEPALSARTPKISSNANGHSVAVEVQNFGQIASEPAAITIENIAVTQAGELVSGVVPALAPFQKTVVELACEKGLKAGDAYEAKVVIAHPAQEPVTFQRTLIVNPGSDTTAATPSDTVQNKEEQDMPLSIQDVMDTILEAIPGSITEDTVDTIKSGDAQRAVTGIVSTFTATVDVLRRAKELRANFVISHEPTYYNHFDSAEGFEGDAVYEYKRKFLEEHDITVWRFHDNWHTIKPDGIIAGVVHQLGWQSFQVSDEPPLFELPETTVGELAKYLKSRLGGNSMRVTGNADMKCDKVGLIVGAPGAKPQIETLQIDDVDVVIGGESPEWETCEYVRDAVAAGMNKALILTGHCNSEEAGMANLVTWLQPRIPGVKVTFVPAGDPFWVVED
jgi:putative NIF3 family GTP cyclohydrolase 1 type 2